MKLTFEKTRGTRTLYFPLERSEDRPADFVVVIRPFQTDPGEQFNETNKFEAGIAFCNPSDQFVKRKGRAIAFERLNSIHKVTGSASRIIENIIERVERVNKRRHSYFRIKGAIHYFPDMDEWQIAADLIQVMSYDALTEYFTKKEEHKVEQQALEA